MHFIPSILPIPSKTRLNPTGFLISALLLLAFPLHSHAAAAPDAPAVEPAHPASIPLWPNGAPGSEARKDEKEVTTYHVGDNYSYTSTTNINNPTITPYLPAKDKATGAAVIIAPGGAHQFLAIDHEGYFVAQWLADHGVAAFVLKYRLARAPGSTYTIAKDSLADAQRAIRLVRSRAAEWNINPNSVGVMGFSAGGEVIALASMKYDDGKADAPDPIERQGSKPSFQALMYPGNSGSIIPDKDSPPAFIACDADDRVDISQGTASAYIRFRQANVSAELHIFSVGGHGFGLGIYKPMPAGAWPGLFVTWLGDRGFLNKK